MATASLGSRALGAARLRGGDLLLPAAVIASVLVILAPLPPALLDLLLALNISASVIVLLTTIYVQTPLEFSVFPSLLLTTTLGRLALNIATTRLILTNADSSGLAAAGGVIRSFGEFVAGDNIIVGIVIFVIIIVIQFMVITKGATRISEVAARFALDGMPGRQMAIDADLNAGVIDEREAQQRRAEITNQADFFGAMDGASKFVRGDAIAGIIITLINILGGLAIGVMQSGMTVSEAASVFTKLTIGDGLASQAPAFLISLAAALLVTRSSTATNLPLEFIRQTLARPEALLVAGSFIGVLAFTSLPKLPLLTIAAGCSGLAWATTQRKKSAELAAAKKAAEPAAPAEERVEDYIGVDPMELEIGVGLIRLADPKRGGDLLDRVQRIRKSIAADVGVVMPKVRIRDNIQLDQNSYRIKIMDSPVAQGEVAPESLMAISADPSAEKIPGVEGVDPAFGTPAVWISTGVRDRAELAGWTVVEPAAVLTTHLAEVVRRHADEILTRDATKSLIDELKKSSPTVVEELIPGVMKLHEVQQVLQLLLREGTPIRQLGIVLETLGDFAPRTKDPILLTEYVRNRLARTICSRLRDADRKLHVVSLDPALEDRIKAGVEHTERGLFVRLSPQTVEQVARAINTETDRLAALGRPAVVLVNPQIRAGLRQMIANRLPHVSVVSYSEVSRDTQVESHALVPDVG